jgi:hypothetical protein
MNIAESFVEYMEDLELGVLGTDIFISQVPDLPDTCWWLTSAGGSPVVKNHTGERTKDYFISVYYRGTNAETVYSTMQDFEESINAKGCVQLDGYDTIEMEASTFPTDTDLDNEERVLALMQVRIRVYQS